MTKKPIIKIENLKKIYAARKGADVLALEDISFDVYEGEFVGIVGPSGCGKSTLLKLIAGVLPITGGKIFIKGKEVWGPQRGIGMVFQFPVLLPWRKVVDNVMLPIEILGLDQETYRKKALDLLKLVGLSGFEYRYPTELSGGMQMRVSISRALIHDPSLLLMDEPFGALDAFTRQELNLELLRIWREKKKTILYVTHDILEAVFLSDRVVVLSERPAKVVDVVNINLPRPRKVMMKASRKYIALCERIRKKIRA